jgi:hypothetical protein
MISESIKAQIRTLWKGSNPSEESCGVIAEDHAIPCQNLALAPGSVDKEYYEKKGLPVPPTRDEDFILAIPSGVKAEAIWHVHYTDLMPGELSFGDIEKCKFNRNQLPYILYRPKFDEHTPECWDYYDPKLANPFPLTNTKDPATLDFYLGWHFIWGRSDCFALVRCYFLGKLGIDIGDFKRPDRNARRTFPQPEYVAPWKAEENGFVRIPRGEVVRINDVVEIAQKGGSNANHIAVIIDDTAMQMLHSPGRGDVSKVEVYSDYWQSRTVNHFRHKNFA